jgi:hypothetical protein
LFEDDETTTKLFAQNYRAEARGEASGSVAGDWQAVVDISEAE